jgi:hypothetical protein
MQRSVSQLSQNWVGFLVTMHCHINLSVTADNPESAMHTKKVCVIQRSTHWLGHLPLQRRQLQQPRIFLKNTPASTCNHSRVWQNIQGCEQIFDGSVQPKNPVKVFEIHRFYGMRPKVKSI